MLTTPFVLSGATEDTAKWQIEIVDPAGAGKSSSMKIDKDGNAHVCYVATPNNALKYGFWDHVLKRWFLMVVDKDANACSLALDSKQHPHISYADYGSGDGSKLRYAHWDGSAWKKRPIPLNSDIITAYSSIGLDANDNPSLSFYEYRGPKGTSFKIRLRNVMWNGSHWDVRTVDGQEGSGKVNNMTVDSQGRFHIAYANVTAGEMRYAYWNGKNWNLETIEGREQNNQQYVGLACAITVDKQGDPHVVYLNTTMMQVKYAVRKGGRWRTQAFDNVAGITEDFDRFSIVVDDANRPHITYYDAGLGSLKVAYSEGPGRPWMSQTIDGNGAGFTSSLQIHDGMMWVSYADESRLALKVARRTLPPSSAAEKTSSLPVPPAPVANSSVAETAKK